MYAPIVSCSRVLDRLGAVNSEGGTGARCGPVDRDWQVPVGQYFTGSCKGGVFSKLRPGVLVAAGTPRTRIKVPSFAEYLLFSRSIL